jgi:hypothetical protein
LIATDTNTAAAQPSTACRLAPDLRKASTPSANSTSITGFDNSVVGLCHSLGGKYPISQGSRSNGPGMSSGCTVRSTTGNTAARTMRAGLCSAARAIHHARIIDVAIVPAIVTVIAAPSHVAPGHSWYTPMTRAW